MTNPLNPDEITKMFHDILLMCDSIFFHLYFSRFLNTPIPVESLSPIAANSYESIIQSWCQLFGNDSENHHWKNTLRYFKEIALPINELGPEIKDFTQEAMSNYLWENLSEQKRAKYWEQIKNYRNKNIAHPFLTMEQYQEAEKNVPKLDIVLRTTLKYYQLFYKIAPYLNKEKSAEIQLNVFPQYNSGRSVEDHQKKRILAFINEIQKMNPEKHDLS